MKILLVDHRVNRADHIRATLRHHDHEVEHLPHVSLQAKKEELQNRSGKRGRGNLTLLERFQPDLVLLHAGNQQVGWFEYLTQRCKRETAVVCFSGRKPPFELLEHCRATARHCYCGQRFDADYDDFRPWEKSPEGRDVMHFLRTLKTNFASAKNLLQGFDPELEIALQLQQDQLGGGDTEPPQC